MANPACSLLNREKKKKEKVWQRPSPPPPPTLLIRRNNKMKTTRRIYMSCLGATQVGVTQISVRLAPVQGFLRLVG